MVPNRGEMERTVFRSGYRTLPSSVADRMYGRANLTHIPGLLPGGTIVKVSGPVYPDRAGGDRPECRHGGEGKTSNALGQQSVSGSSRTRSCVRARHLTWPCMHPRWHWCASSEAVALSVRCVTGSQGCSSVGRPQTRRRSRRRCRRHCYGAAAAAIFVQWARP